MQIRGQLSSDIFRFWEIVTLGVECLTLIPIYALNNYSLETGAQL